MLLWVVGVGGFHDNWDLGSQEILSSIRTFTNEAERTPSHYRYLIWVLALFTSLATPVPSSSSSNGPTTITLMCPGGSVVWAGPT